MMHLLNSALFNTIVLLTSTFLLVGCSDIRSVAPIGETGSDAATDSVQATIETSALSNTAEGEPIPEDSRPDAAPSAEAAETD